ncbi:ankyrin repeat domain-containing protein [Wolbachia endosymbiont of Ctenocephalides felis wCfeJ]|uniref:hypothetical protein n=1 Tax=Wolbachia endosymbiont of Ctenocephalides felis wCfeJ TaxID=2732594 RepID=UPI0014473B73|nr:hypothetical protein [Wolbachia endosymbiont of Ctenocephalides felis wCfeJ]WCR58150.1 MAG: hypothetical protein PG980_000622 [Wolbachia endosymbiont of Ctenocephalides felis wCfeJ]
MTHDYVLSTLQAIEESNIEKLRSQLDGGQEAFSTRNYINFLHTALKPHNPSYKIINEIIKWAKNHKKKQELAGKSSVYKVVNSRSDDGTERTPLQIALEKSNPKEKIIKLLIDNGADISDRYIGPTDIAKQRILSNNSLHIAARTRNVGIFLLIFKKGIENNVSLLEYNHNRENPFHIAARNGTLPVIVEGILDYLQSTTNDEIGRLENSIKEDKKGIQENQKKLREVKAKLESNKDYVRNALYSKYALNQEGKTPLSYISNREEKENIKKAVGIKDRLVYHKKLNLCLYAAGAVACIAIICGCALLFPTSQALVLGAIVSMFMGRIFQLSLKAYNEANNLRDEYTKMRDIEVTESQNLGLQS